MYHSRLLAATLKQALGSFPAVLVTGPRQSGKTTFLRHQLGESAEYVSFDDPLEREFARLDPSGFLSRFGLRPVILDEIQYVPDLMPHLKLRIDASPDRLGQWILTGSQQFALMRGVGESLAGRVATLELPPFSHIELARRSLEASIWDGGYPIPALHPERRALWLSSYLATYIERDVRQLRSISDLRAFTQFVALCAAHHAQAFSAAGLSREVGVTLPTIQAWSGVLEASYVAFLLKPWFRNYGKRVVKSPKLYFLDPALVCMLTRQPDAASALSGSLGGALFEGWVITEAIKAFMARGLKPDLHFWHSHDGLELDLLISAAGRLNPVEIKLSASPSAGHLAPIEKWIALAGEDSAPQGLLVCRTERERHMPGGHLALPWQRFPAWIAELLDGARPVG